MMNTIETIKLHFIYCAVISAGIFIFLATDRWTGQNNFTEYLTNAATMTSLLLGVIAIFYSMISNGDLSKTVGSISQAANEINSAKLSISDISAQSKSNSVELHDISQAVSASIESLKNVVAEFERHSESVQSSIGMLPERLSSIEAKLMQGAPANLSVEPAATGASAPDTEDSSKMLLSRISAFGGLYIYAASLAFKNNAPINLDEAAKIISPNSVDYFYGVAMGLSGANIISIRKDSPRSKLVIEDMPLYLRNLTKNDMLEWASRFKIQMREKILPWLDQLEELF